jgi:GntR family transcriptional regulator
VTGGLTVYPAGAVPRYAEIEQALRTKIASLRPGDLLPSDAELCREYDVSRMTARQAIDRLKAEGLVVRRPGHGTFVAEHTTHRQAGRLLNFSEEMRRRGMSARSVLIGYGVRPASGDEQAQLELPAGSTVVALERVRVGDDQPIAVETAVLPGDCASALDGVDLEQGSLHEALLRSGRCPTAGRGSLHATPATATDARLLAIKRGSPLLVENRLIYDQDQKPLELGETRYAADRYVLELEFGVEMAARQPRPRRRQR